MWVWLGVCCPSVWITCFISGFGRLNGAGCGVYLCLIWIVLGCVIYCLAAGFPVGLVLIVGVVMRFSLGVA